MTPRNATYTFVQKSLSKAKQIFDGVREMVKNVFKQTPSFPDFKMNMELRKRLNETNAKGRVLFHKSEGEDGTDVMNCSITAQLGSMQKPDEFANMFLKRVTLCVLGEEKPENIEHMIKENPELVEASSEVINAGLARYSMTCKYFKKKQEEALARKSMLQNQIQKGAMEEEQGKNAEADEAFQYEDLLSELDGHRRTVLNKAKRLSNLPSSESLLEPRKTRPITENDNSDSNISYMPSEEVTITRHTPDQENIPPRDSMKRDTPKPQITATKCGFKEYGSYLKKKNNLAEQDEDYIKSYRMTDEEDDNSEDEIPSVTYKRDPNANGKTRPFMGSKRVPLWADSKMNLNKQIRE